MDSNSSRPTINNFFSEKLRIVSFFLIVVVFLIHTDFPSKVYATMPIPVVVRSCIVGVIGPCAVPLFFAISGYLFFYGIEGISDVLRKMRKRVKTLLIPFIIAALIYPAILILIELLPGASEHIKSESVINLFANEPITYIIKSLFFDYGSGYPLAYHLWFLRDLIIIVAIMPLLYVFRKTLGVFTLVVFVILYFFFPHHSLFFSLIWFFAGSFFLDQINRIPRWCIYWVVPLFLVMAVCYQITDHSISRFLKVVEIVLGICSIWYIYDMIVPKDFTLSANMLLNTACKYTFFLYLYHVPAYHIIVKGIPLLFGANQLGYTLSFLLSPLIFIPVWVSFGCILRKYTPCMYNIMVGYR